jgi:hypothetical protein
MINQTSYEKWGDQLKISSENVVFLMLQAIFRLNKSLIDNPDDILKTRIIYEKELNKIANKFSKEWKNWADYDIANAYLDGFNQSESQLKQLGKNTAIIKTIQNGAFLINNSPVPPVPPVPPMPGQVLTWFDGFESQLTWLGVFRNAAYYNLERQSLQILRVGKDIFRDIAVMAGESSFKEADIFTRRALSQKMLNDYARRGIQSIVYKNGARHSIDDYCEMVGRTMAGRTAVQASLNRFFQSGYTLVIVSSHFRACPLCVPYEGKILSIDKHPVYESIDDATTQGLFHPRCAHDVSAWFEEITPKKTRVANGEQGLIDKYGYNEAQRISYNAQLRQREIERNIRKYKRRLSVSLDPVSQARANQKIKEWQKKQRDHIKENDFLRRKYEREQIRKAY